MVIQLPFTSDPAQSVTVQLGSTKYDFDVRWNDRAALWLMDVIDHATQALIVAGVPLVLGVDLLSPYALDAGALVCNDEDNSGVDAGSEDLGARVNVYWFSDGVNS